MYFCIFFFLFYIVFYSVEANLDEKVYLREDEAVNVELQLNLLLKFDER